MNKLITLINEIINILMKFIVVLSVFPLLLGWFSTTSGLPFMEGFIQGGIIDVGLIVITIVISIYIESKY